MIAIREAWQAGLLQLEHWLRNMISGFVVVLFSSRLPGLQRLILMLRRVPFIDITGIQSLEEALRDPKRRGVDVILCGANPRVKAKLDKAGLLDIVGPGGYHDDLHAALTQVDWGATLADQPGRTESEESR